MVTCVHSVSLLGLDAKTIDIEVDLQRGKHSFFIVGLAAKEVDEAKERIPSAIKNSDIDFPKGRVIINLAPADLRKEGVAFDVPIAIGMVARSQGIDAKILQESMFVGQLALDGRLRPIRGVLSMVEHAKSYGYKHIFVPIDNAQEASIVEGIDVYACDSLRVLVEHLKNNTLIQKQPIFDIHTYQKQQARFCTDMCDIKGQIQAKRALEIAASGGHNVAMSGAPGSGKSLLAKAFSGILPPMNREEILEVTRIYSAAGMLETHKPLIVERPFRKVHHSASGASIVGGGRVVKPGEITLAHRGALFLDEFAEFSTALIELLRQPLEDRCITVSRVAGSLSYPAQFILIAAMNPCKCGYYGVPNAIKKCICSPMEIGRYQKKISGPILDRIDLYVDIPSVDYKKLGSMQKSESSESVRSRVLLARNIQSQRFQKSHIHCNSEMGLREIEYHCQLDHKANTFLENAAKVYQLSARSYHRVLKIARTIADLEEKKQIEYKHLAEALQFRKKNDDAY